MHSELPRRAESLNALNGLSRWRQHGENVVGQHGEKSQCPERPFPLALSTDTLEFLEEEEEGLNALNGLSRWRAGWGTFCLRVENLESQCPERPFPLAPGEEWIKRLEDKEVSMP